MVRHIALLIRKEWILDFRSRSAVSGIVLYIVATVYVLYLSVDTLTPTLWSGLIWVTLLFSGITAVNKSFVQEPPARHLYYYSTVSPQAVIIAKILYNAAFLVLLTVLAFVIFGLLMGFQIHNAMLMLGILMAGAAGLSVTLSMVSAIAWKAGNSPALMAVLSFPLLIPLLLTLMKLSRAAVLDMWPPDIWKDALIFGALSLISLFVAVILFPYLWKD